MPDAGAPGPSARRAGLVALILAVTATSVAYRLLVLGRLEQTAALFIGLPLLLALALAFSPKSATVTGLILKGITLFLLLSGILLGEGLICILMAAPLFYLVGVVCGLIADHIRERSPKSSGPKTLMAFAPLAVLSLEGVHGGLSFPRDETVVTEAIVTGSATEVEERLGRPLRLDRPLPPFLRVGFPRPVRTEGSGLAIGDRREIRFAGGEGRPGNLVFVVAEREAGRVRYRALADSSHIAHWLQWQSADIQWTEIGGGRTRVRTELRYRRLLDPAWYFAPWERWAVRLAGQYLNESQCGSAGDD